MKHGGWLLAFVTAGALVRIVLLRAPEVWFDETTTGLMGLAVLRGDFPLYFFGQPFMGALDAYLAAPLYLTLGVSVRVLKVLPLVLVLVWMVLTVRLAWEGFGRRAATFTAALLALPPDFLLSWSVEARTHYQLSVVLGTLALLLALRISASPRRGVLAGFGVLGGVLGLAFWTNFLSLVFWPPVALLLFRRGLRRLIPGLAIATGGFTLGSLPHWVYGLQHGTALPPPGSWIGLAQVFDNLGVAARVSWPIIAGVPESLRERWPGVFLAATLAVSYALAVTLAARAARRAGPRARSVGLALGALVVVNVGVAVATQYGQRLDDSDQKYLLPVYTALPVLLGGGLAELPLAAGAALAVGLLVVQGAACAMETLQGLAPAAIARVEAERRAQLEAIALMEDARPRTAVFGRSGDATGSSAWPGRVGSRSRVSTSAASCSSSTRRLPHLPGLRSPRRACRSSSRVPDVWPAGRSTGTRELGGRRPGRRRQAIGSAWTSPGPAPSRRSASGRSSATSGRAASSSRPQPTGRRGGR